MTVNPTGNRYCEQCGKQLQLACARCGHDVALFARFCGNCGSGVQAAEAGHATPKWGELKQATVLFADIVGSTELVAHMDPEQAMARLRPAVLRMRHSVERFGGTVVRTLGDGVMSMFGVPRALEGHALLACQSALHMQAAFGHGGDGLKIRIGLHSGQVASDPEDAEDGRGGGAHGLTIHLASRVIGLAQPGGVTLTLACRREAGPGCLTTSMGMHRLKGIPEPVEILALEGVEAAARRNATARLVQTTFRGRTHELALLTRTIAEAGTPQALNVLGIAGEPGAGKSRLCEVFTQQCMLQGIPVFDVRAQLYGHSLPLQPILELFRTHFFGIAPGNDAFTAREHIAGAFEPLATDDTDLQLLYEFFRVADPDMAPLALSPRARQSRVAGLMRQLVRHDAGTRRVILIEDLHWIDDASEEFVATIADAVAGTQTLLLLNYRPAYRAPWLRQGSFRQLELGELPPADMDALVGELLTDTTSLPDICRLVCERAGGNPFFAEELVRTIVESGLIDPATGLPVGGLQSVEQALPATLQAVIGARLDRVGEPEKTLLQMCAIIGKEIPLAVLEHVASPLAAQIEHGLDGLCQAGLILPQHTPGGRTFAFRHPLIQEVAYTTQLKVRRGQVHASVAQAMELYYAGQVDEFAGLIAYHFEQAGQPRPAARYNARAADWVASADSRRAMASWRKVRELLKTVPADAESDSLQVLACAKIAWLSWREGTPMAEVMPFIREAREIAGDGDARILRLLLFLEGRMLQANGASVDRYAELVSEALAMMDPQASAGSKMLLHTALCQAYGWGGVFSKALAASEAALAGADEVDPIDQQFIGYSLRQWILVLRGRLLARLSRLDEARGCLREVTDTPASQVDPVLMQIAHYGLTEVACMARDAEAAEHHAAVVAQIAKRQENAYLNAFANACRAMVHQLQEEFEPARAKFREALALVRTHNVAKEFETELLACLAECSYALGDLAIARAHSVEAISLCHERNNRHQHVRALAIASAIARGEGDAGQADALHAQARRLVRDSEAGGLAFRVAVLPELVFD
ncbi:ATP-binding protein [Ramlibacter sp. PS4R-6]|uniref:ATP-binding protein n=1 Tax=Ramlibacter sp. PS4R-6 TaxID=3133438 RepID=UPI0030B770D8